MRNNKGITLVSLIAYIILMVIVIGILSVLTVNFRRNIGNTDSSTVKDMEFDKLNSELVKQTKNEYNEIQITKCTSNKIVFYDGFNRNTYTYSSEDKAVYVNEYIKVAGDIDTCTFAASEAGGEQSLTVTVSINGKQRVTEYKMARRYEERVPERPDLIEGMIPVEWNGENWIRVDSIRRPDWYEYGNKIQKRRWANAVTVKESGTKTRAYYLSEASIGDAIPMEDILGMYVWIPRYRYKIVSSYHYPNTGDTVDDCGWANIQFIRATQGGTIEYDEETTLNFTVFPDGFVLHPAFTFGTQEISGIWVAKFEASSSQTTSSNPNTGNKYGRNGTLGVGQNKDEVTIRPNVTSWRAISAYNAYVACTNMMGETNGVMNTHGLTGGDSHLMKDTEWGAVAYLTQSVYGNAQTSTTSGVWNNSYYNGDGYYGTKTGMVGSTRDDSTSNTATAKQIAAKTYYTYETENGVKGSTTGTIYGIYDMAGGSWEYQASYLNGVNNTNITTFNSYVPLKHKTTLTGTRTNNNFTENGVTANGKYFNYLDNKGVYGNAVYETSKLVTGGEGSNSWNSDYSDFVYPSYPFVMCGGSFVSKAGAGLFSFDNSAGVGGISHGFRPVLVAE